MTLNMPSILCRFVALAMLAGALSLQAQSRDLEAPRPCIAGIYPHLAMMNKQGECGTGAVVPWADRLWVVTYAPHMPMGSDDRLYEITPSLEQIIRPESIGGTPANRMIHRESNQLNIGPYFIDAERKVRAISYNVMSGRPTATARHLTDPAGKVYITTMEEGLYEVDVKTLGVKCWINDSNNNKNATDYPDAINSALPGYHGKGSYTGQGKLFYSNNGEHGEAAKKDPTTPSGALAYWGGPGSDWQLLVREQFTEITGPGGIHGSTNDNEAIWALGWDHKSVLLMLLDNGQWHTYRLPKASFSYDGAHGWNTEWPRIREIGEGDDYLATMHGTFWHFPRNFSLQNSSGIRPRSNYLKVVGDFARWGDYVVLGCDDSAKSEFLNKRAFKAEQGSPMRSNSNLWFVKPQQLSELGPALGSGGVWLNENVKAGTVSDSYLFGGYDKRAIHLSHRSERPVTFKIEIDEQGDGQWRVLTSITIDPALGNYTCYVFTSDQNGQWIRVSADHDAPGVTAWLSYAKDDTRGYKPNEIFAGLATTDTANDLGGLMRSLGGDDLPLGLIAQRRDSDEQTFYLLNDKLELVPSDDAQRRAQTKQAAAPDTDAIPLKRDGQSILVEEDGKRYRLPLQLNAADDKPFSGDVGFARRVREIATERDMVNIAGTFYELPARNAGGFSHIRPIASHPFRIHDFCSWRGLLVLTGIELHAINERIIKSDDGKAAVWVGVVDELWQMGKPVGVGGPWADTKVKAGEPSDPYLMHGYDQKSMVITADTPIRVTIQIDPSGTGTWLAYKTSQVTPEQHLSFEFPDGFNAHWVRLISDTDATVTAMFVYK